MISERLHRRAESTPATGALTSSDYWDAQWVARHTRQAAKRWRPSRLAARDANELLAEAVHSLGPEPADIFEVGCAPGLVIEYLSRCCPQHRYHGLDYAPQSVSLTRQYLGHRDVEVLCGDALTFVPPRQFDLVYSSGLIEHFDDPLPMLQAHRRFCRPGGLVVVTVPNYSHPLAKWLIRRLDPTALETHNLEIMDLGVVRRLMEAAGLSDVRVGYCGPSTLRTKCGQSSAGRFLLRTAGRGWNLVARTASLRVGWSATIWARGRVSP